MKPDLSGHSPYGTGSVGCLTLWRPGRGRREARSVRRATRSVAVAAVLLAGGCKWPFVLPNAASSESRPPLRAESRAATPVASPAFAPGYLVRPDSGERRVLQQLLHELRLCRNLIDEAYAQRDERARVRVDYARLAADFNSVLAGIQQTLAATETAPRGPDAVRGEYRLYE